MSASPQPPEQARRLKTLTLASHELRTPLASIIGFSEILLKGEHDAATTRELLEIVHAQALRLSLVMNGAFDLARLEAGGRAALRIAPEPLGGLVLQALANAAPLGQNARIVLDIAPGLPPLAADGLRLALAIGNLLSNALRYSEAPAPVTLRARAEPGTGMVLVDVADRGIGMGPEVVAHLFDAFYRGPGAAEGGAGLGMALVREIVELHGGGVEVVSTPGAGTTVTLRLPAASEAPDA